jgi:hypothetical protein
MLDISPSSLQDIERVISEHQFALPDKDLIFTRCLNEAWFSNTLAWLLNPKGSHKLGVAFANEFLKTIAQIRTDKQSDYIRRRSLLKWGKGGLGTLSTHFSLKNATVLREFYLAQSINSRVQKGPKYCDIVFLDLDTSDSLFVAIENKLFTSNHPDQLETYYTLVENNFSRASVREYVYLTLHGIPPINYVNYPVEMTKYWVRLSWSHHILTILNTLKSPREHKEVIKLRHLLMWLHSLNQPALGQVIETLRNVLLNAAASCLHEELVRLGDGKPGKWEVRNLNGNSITILHTSRPKSPLFVELLPNLSVTVQSRKKNRPLFEKIIVPYGANVDQTFNLLDIAARDVYHSHFPNTTARYLANKRRLTTTLTSTKKKMKPIFEYVSQNQYELRILLSASQYVWDAQKFALQEIES